MKPTTLAWMTCAVLAVHTGAHAQTLTMALAMAQALAPTIEPAPAAHRDHALRVMGSPTASGVGAAVRWPIGARLGVRARDRAEARGDHRGQRRAEPGLRPAGDRAGDALRRRRRRARALWQGDLPARWQQPLLGTDTGLTVNAGGGIRVPVNDAGSAARRCGSTARDGRTPTSGASTTAPRSASAASAESARKYSSLELDRSSNSRSL